ncbi:MAG: threonylcarbamoyl-AMP synthase [Rhodospirillales bacterium]|nr:threonylcarbamoyl-AMP synthase [Alphaproteobacteria bacterium]MBL6947501.1 threonylcarbamoyl-AMP synthase [Rhodospirillales bacterium]
MTKARPPILPFEPEAIAAAAEVLRRGGLVAFPTETVYGLGCDATDGEAVARVFAAKDRPRFNPLIVHVRDTAAAREIVEFNDMAEDLARAFWPGALTLVLPRRDECVSLLVSAGLETLAVRVPNHPVAKALLEQSAIPIAAPSANRAGRISPTAAGHVAFSLPGPEDGGPEMILDGGPCQVGVESTVIDLSAAQPTLLRPGGIAAEDIGAVTGPLAAPVAEDGGDTKAAHKSPGMMDRHYAPELPLRLDAEPNDSRARDGEALLAFGPLPPGAEEAMNLSPTGDLKEAAANLFSMIRALDGPPFTAIAVMTVPDIGLGRAINDRLRRARQSPHADDS